MEPRRRELNVWFDTACVIKLLFGLDRGVGTTPSKFAPYGLCLTHSLSLFHQPGSR
jgi:hypothetical protein